MRILEDKSIFHVVWELGKREYALLILLILFSLPLTYLAVELPKHLVNLLSGDLVSIASWSFVQNFARDDITLLLFLSLAFFSVIMLVRVTEQAIMALKGICGERVLCRFRSSYLQEIPETDTNLDKDAVSLRVTYELEQLRGFLENVTVTPLKDGGQLITLIFFIFIQDTLFGLVALSVVPVQVLILFVFQSYINDKTKESVDAVRSLDTTLSAEVDDDPTDELETVSRVNGAKYLIKFFSKSLSDVVGRLPTVALYIYGGTLVLQGAADVGVIVAIVAAQQSMQITLGRLFIYYRQEEGARVRFQKIQSLCR